MNSLTKPAAVVAAAALVALAAAADLGPTRKARFDAWRIIGPGGGGTMRRPAISPHDPRLVMLGCDMTGAYITSDGGASWRMFNLGSVPTAFAFDPSHPQTLYAGAEAVYRSDDAGRTWRMVLPDPAKNTVARSIGDHGDRVFFTDDPAYPGSGRSVTIHAIAVDEDDSLTPQQKAIEKRAIRSNIKPGKYTGDGSGGGSSGDSPEKWSNGDLERLKSLQHQENRQRD